MSLILKHIRIIYFLCLRYFRKIKNKHSVQYAVLMCNLCVRMDALSSLKPTNS